MATHDYVIANASGAAVRADLNNALAAIVSNNSNATEPATTYSYQWWADTTAGQLKLRNAANDGWIVIQELDGTMLMEDGTAASPGLAFASDLDTGLLRPGANQFAISTAGNQRLVVDASGQVGIGETTPGTLVEINSETPYVTLKNSTQEDTDGGRESKVIFEGEQSGGEITTLAQIEVSHDGAADDQKGKIIFSTNDGADGAAPTAALTIGSDQNIDIGSGNIALNADGSATLAGGDVVITSSGNVKAGDPDNSQGSVLSPIGQSYVRKDGGGSTDPAYAVYNGGLSSAGKYAAINFDGSAVFSQGNVALQANGTCNFNPGGNTQTDAGITFKDDGLVSIYRPTGSAVNLFEAARGASVRDVVYKITSAGDTVQSGTVTATNVSDIRFKENITDARPQLADVVALGSQLKNWDWKDTAPLNDGLRSKRFLGLVAQEAEKVCPGLTYQVPTDEGTDAYKAINHDILVMKLLGAVAEQNTRIEALEAKVQTLEATNASLEARLTALEGGAA